LNYDIAQQFLSSNVMETTEEKKEEVGQIAMTPVSKNKQRKSLFAAFSRKD
jgi:hypothetical protein